MIVRKLNSREKGDACLISMYCFHVREGHVEEAVEKAQKETEEDWGAFDDDGTLMARIINNRFNFYIDGKTVPTGGIGAVSTLPEYRDHGAIRGIFEALLPEAYRNGEVLSALYPFKHSFYRQFGYETVILRNDYEMSPSVLSGYRFNGKVKKWNTGDPVDEYLRIYRQFARNLNLAAERDAVRMLEHMKVEKPYVDRKFSYMLHNGTENIAWLTFTDVYNDPAPILQVEECAWTNGEGFRAILGFLARFEADYGTIRLPLPNGVELLRIIRSPRAYEIRKTTRQDFMVRVIHVKKLLETMKRPEDTDLLIRVKDEVIEENNGVWHLTGNNVQKMNESTVPDMTVSERAFGQLAVGAINPEEALLREDTVIYGKMDMIRRVFTAKSIFNGEHF